MKLRSVVFGVLVLVGALLPAAAAFGQSTDYVGTPTPEVAGEQASVSPAVAAADGTKVLGEQVQSGGLAFTGSDVAGMTVVGLAAIGIGVFLVRRSRRPQLA